jgi:hypothetical protein
MRDWKTVQRAERFAARLSFVGLLRAVHRAVSDEGDDRIDARIHAIDPGEVRFHHLAGRDFLGANTGSEIDGCQVTEVVARDGWHRRCRGAFGRAAICGERRQ